MPLQAQLDAFNVDFGAGEPSYKVIASGAAQRAPKTGDTAPVFSLPDADGHLVSSADLLKKGPLVVSFYRGVWCLYCNMELQALRATLPDYRASGASLGAIPPRTAPNSRKSERQIGVDFPILSDARGDVASAFGLHFELSPYLIEMYKQLKSDLPSFNTDPGRTLPMPARYGIASDGVIAYAEVNPDFTRRPEPSDLLPSIRSASVRVPA